MRPLLLLLFLALGAAAQDEEAMARIRQALAEDPSAAEALAERLARSPFATQITRETEPGPRKATLIDWILSDPESASYLAAGLAQDDAEKSTRFQDMARRRHDSLRYNPGSEKNLFSRLRKSGTDSKLLGQQSEELADEEKREILKTIFEGEGGQSKNILTRQDAGKPPEAGGEPAAALAGPSYFDRLSQANLRGYSPQLLALQSALNLRRPPGAPKLIESGKLDYATLSYPAYGLRFDIANLEARLRYQRNYESAKLLGLERSYAPERLLDPAVEAELKAKAAGLKVNPLFEKRALALEKARAALAEFNRTALAARDPVKISKALLSSLGARQREAARWITAASLEEELQRLESEDGFLTPELLAMIEACPFPPQTRQAYRKRGEGFQENIRRMKDNARQALLLLEADSWQAHVAQVEKSLAQNTVLRRDLSRNIRDFTAVPYRLLQAHTPRPRWRQWLDELIMRLLPSNSYSRALKNRAEHKARLADVFVKIAAGDLDAAHAVLASLVR